MFYVKSWIALAVLVLILISGCSQNENGATLPPGENPVSVIAETGINQIEEQDTDKQIDTSYECKSTNAKNENTTDQVNTEAKVSSSVTTSNSSSKGDQTKLVAEATKDNKTKCNGTILYFYTQTCLACRKQSPILDQWIKDNKNKITGIEFIKIDLTDSDNQETAKKLGITYIPAFIVKNGSGSVIAKADGAQSMEQLNKMAELLLDRKEQ